MNSIKVGAAIEDLIDQDEEQTRKPIHLYAHLDE